jgi:competence protein ComEA
MLSRFSTIKTVRIGATNLAHDRLQTILGERVSVAPNMETQQVIYEPPPNTFRPIAKATIFAAVVVAFLAWLNRPQAVATPIVEQSGLPVAASAAAIQTGEIVVDIEGLVTSPGLKTLPAGSRVADAVAAAGGLSSPEAAGAINLAQRLSDGQLITIGVTPIASGDIRVSINQATVTELDTLPGVGPVMAQRIIDWRTAHQQFSSIEELQEVPGIGPKVFANLKDLISL